MINPIHPGIRYSNKAIGSKPLHTFNNKKNPDKISLKIDPSELSFDIEKKDINFTAKLPLSKDPTITNSFYQTLNKEQFEEHQREILNIGETLPMVVELRQELQTNGSAVVYGPSGSGKTEQIEIALGTEQTLFDLRNDFLENYFDKNNIPQEDRKNIGKQYYSPEMKKHERTFLEENKQQIINKLVEDENEIIVIDEFDLASKQILSEDELASCLTTLEIANEVRKSGKKVVMILHNSGMQSPQVLESLQRNELLKPNSKVVRTSFLNVNTQKRILKSFNFSEFQIDRIIQLSSGSPVTYLGFLKECGKSALGKTSRTLERPKFEELVKESYTRISSIWDWAKKLESKETVALLTQLALGEISIDDETVLKSKDTLLITGMLGEINGKLVLPKISKNMIKDDLRNSRIENRYPNKYVEIHNENDTHKHLNTAPKAIQEAAKNALSSSPSVYLIDDFGGVPIIIPKIPSAVSEIMQHNKKIISDKLELNNLPMEHSSTEHLNWANTAATANELHNDAQNVAGFFFKVVEDACSPIDAKIHAGDNYQFLVKSEKSILQKIDKYSFPGSNPSKVLQKINDPVRATIICDNVRDLRDSIRRFQILTKQSQIKTVYSNKWEMDYSNGYVGVHANVLMTYNAPDGSFSPSSPLF
ncbi:MAG: ATP-binding protein [Parachlamydiaceae bacterium]|nr:ATP-binding protein [Parachlamydiaceae bacterium]